jgi:hypothetical protein
MRKKIILIFLRVIIKLKIDRLLSDKCFLDLVYYKSFGRYINWNNPRSYNEKLQWMKVYNRHPIYTDMVDKLKVKEFVAKILGPEYIIPTLGVWDDANEINWDALPDKFVLKCNHDSGSIFICKDKANFNFERAKKELNNCLKKNKYRLGREWAYKDVKRKIFAESYMEDEETMELRDYKIFNFNGKPRYIQVDYGRFTQHMRNVYDTDWNRIDFKSWLGFASNSQTVMSKPPVLDKMLEAAQLLSKDLPTVRTDFYMVNGKMYFGEITFYPGAGLSGFEPEELDYKLGDMIVLPLPVNR